MTTHTMTVHEALAELKVLGARIEKQIAAATFVTTNKHSNTKIAGKSIEDYETSMVADLQSIQDLIARRSAIKRAVTQSNADTYITLDNGIKMSVAEAIEYKTVGITYKERLLNAIIFQYKESIKIATMTNGSMLEEKANDYIHGLYNGKEKEVDGKSVTAQRTAYIEMNTLDLIDPNNAADLIKKLNNEIDYFNSKVDAALSVSNATTTITFEV